MNTFFSNKDKQIQTYTYFWKWSYSLMSFLLINWRICWVFLSTYRSCFTVKALLQFIALLWSSCCVLTAVYNTCQGKMRTIRYTTYSTSCSVWTSYSSKCNIQIDWCTFIGNPPGTFNQYSKWVGWHFGPLETEMRTHEEWRSSRQTDSALNMNTVLDIWSLCRIWRWHELFWSFIMLIGFGIMGLHFLWIIMQKTFWLRRLLSGLNVQRSSHWLPVCQDGL